jgi:hypothetical protein
MVPLSNKITQKLVKRVYKDMNSKMVYFKKSLLSDRHTHKQRSYSPRKIDSIIDTEIHMQDNSPIKELINDSPTTFKNPVITENSLDKSMRTN